MAISRMQEPRQLYGLGSLVKSIGKGVKKFVKSPLGKAALLVGCAHRKGIVNITRESSLAWNYDGGGLWKY